MLIPDDVINIINTLENFGFEAFIVGGCVRDFLLAKTPKDWDITTNALPKDIKKIFTKTIDTGIEHGTVTVVINKNNYEVTTYRIDGEYADFRHPKKVSFTSNIREDLSRRDFTINAIACNPTSNIYIDFFDGKIDINNKIVKGVGIPEVRFNEDALRMMRAVRFVNQLGFQIEKNTFNAIKKNAYLIKKISIERIRDEFIKLISSDYIENLILLEKSNLLQYFLPEISIKINSDYNKNIIILKNIKNNYILRLTFLLSHLDEKNAVNVLKRLKFDNLTIKSIKLILKYFNIDLKDNITHVRKTMSVLEPNYFKDLITLKFIISRANYNLKECKRLDNIYDQINSVLKNNQCYSLKHLEINGNDLKNLGISNGKIIGEILNRCLDFVIENPDKNNKKILLNKSTEFYKEYI